jgi:hypothetical protein
MNWKTLRKIKLAKLYIKCYTIVKMSKQINFRANKEDLRIIKRLVRKLGITQTAVLKQALRCLDAKEK